MDDLRVGAAFQDSRTSVPEGPAPAEGNALVSNKSRADRIGPHFALERGLHFTFERWPRCALERGARCASERGARLATLTSHRCRYQERYLDIIGTASLA